MSPKLTLDTPRLVSTPGNSRLINRIPSMVSAAESIHSCSPVASVNVSASKMRSEWSEPELRGGNLENAPGDLQLSAPRTSHPLLVYREGDDGGPVLADERQHMVDALPAVFHVDGVDDAAPGRWASAAAITAGSVESIMRAFPRSSGA